MTSYRFFKMADIQWKSASGFVFREVEIYLFGEISQSTAEIKLLSVSENGRQLYRNSTSGFDFDLCVVIGMSFCICMPNFVVIGRSTVEL